MPDAAPATNKLSRLMDLGFERVHGVATATEVRRPDRRTVLVTTGRPAMGTLVSVSAIGRSQDRIEQAIGRALAEMDRLIRIFSRFEGDSALTALNDAGRLAGPPPELAHVVTRALEYRTMTRGAFDVTVEPLVNLFRECFAGVRRTAPSDGEIAEARSLVGARHVTASGREIRFARAGMGVTLDGIAKGFLVDAMAQTLTRSGVRDFLINAGGDIRTGGAGEKGRPWSVGVRDPAGAGAFRDTIHVRGAAVATSGGYEIYFSGDPRVHHILDGSTGRSPNTSASVSVTAPTAMAADALATAVCVMDADEGVALVESLAGCACFVLGHDGRVRRSRGWRSMDETER